MLHHGIIYVYDMLALRTCQPYQAVLTVNLQRDALGSIFAKTRWMHNHRLPNASLNINKHDTLALDAILISFSAKQPAVLGLQRKRGKLPKFGREARPHAAHVTASLRTSLCKPERGLDALQKRARRSETGQRHAVRNAVVPSSVSTLARLVHISKHSATTCDRTARGQQSEISSNSQDKLGRP